MAGGLYVLFEKLPENKLKNAIRFWTANSACAPHFMRRICPLVGYEYVRPLKAGDIVVDVGAYTGDYTIFASRKVGPTGRVIAIEPDPNNARRLRRNLRGELDNVTVLEAAVWSAPGRMRFKFAECGLQSGPVVCVDETIRGVEDTVEVTTLDELIKGLKLPRVDVLKMDIEGAEIEVLKGCRATLMTESVYVCVASYHVVDGKTTSEAMEQQLRDLGYTAFTGFPGHTTTFGWRLQSKCRGNSVEERTL